GIITRKRSQADYFPFVIFIFHEPIPDPISCCFVDRLLSKGRRRSTKLHERMRTRIQTANNKSKMSSLRFMIMAGEASGDAHGAALVRALREAAPQTEFEFFGATGAQMRETGVDSVVRSDSLSILGLWEIARALPEFWRAFREVK